MALHYNGTTWTPSYPFGTPSPAMVLVLHQGLTTSGYTGQGCTSSGVNYVARYNGHAWTTSRFKLATSENGKDVASAPVVTTEPTNGWIFSEGARPRRPCISPAKKWVPVTLGNFGDVIEASTVCPPATSTC